MGQRGRGKLGTTIILVFTVLTLVLSGLVFLLVWRGKTRHTCYDIDNIFCAAARHEDIYDYASLIF